MARGEFDLVDVLASPLFMVGALADNNIVEFPTVMGFSPTDILWSAGAHTEVTWATLLTLAALGVLIGTNKPQLDIYGGLQSWMVIITAILVVAPPFVPILEAFITHNMGVGLVAFFIQSSGYALISWLG